MIFWDISFISLVMSFVIAVTSFFVYKKAGSKSALFIGIAYIFFILPRAAYLGGFTMGHSAIFVFMRFIAYSLEIYAVILLGKKR